jgi:hypothetical protein
MKHGIYSSVSETQTNIQQSLKLSKFVDSTWVGISYLFWDFKYHIRYNGLLSYLLLDQIQFEGFLFHKAKRFQI